MANCSGSSTFNLIFCQSKLASFLHSSGALCFTVDIDSTSVSLGDIPGAGLIMRN